MKQTLSLIRAAAILFLIAEIIGVCWAIKTIREVPAANKRQVEHVQDCLLELFSGIPSKYFHQPAGWLK